MNAVLCAAPRSDRMHPDNLAGYCQFDRLVLSLAIGRTVTCKPEKYRERSGDRIILRDKSPFLKDKPSPSKRLASIWAIREVST